MNAIKIKNLKKSYGDFTLRDISLTLPQGSILGLVGENGAGKSTTINLIMNAIASESGSISVLGLDNKSPAFRQAKEDIGVVLDEAYFPESLTAKRLQTVMKHTYKNWDTDCYLKYLKDFQLPMDKLFREFSRGMKMKLAIAVALSHNPKLLILDEATSGLDPMMRDEILTLFNDFTREETHSVLLSSHIVSDLEKICDYIAFLHRGKLLFCEEKDRLLEEYAIVKLSNKDFENIPQEAVKGMKKSDYGVEALICKTEVTSAIATEHTTLEDIILFLGKGDDA